MLDSSLDVGSKVVEVFFVVRSGEVKFSDDKAFLKVRYFLFECEKIVFKLNFFFFKVVVSAHDTIDGVSRIAGKEVMIGFTLKVDTLLDAEGLDGKSRNH